MVKMGRCAHKDCDLCQVTQQFSSRAGDRIQILWFLVIFPVHYIMLPLLYSSYLQFLMYWISYYACQGNMLLQCRLRYLVHLDALFISSENISLTHNSFCRYLGVSQKCFVDLCSFSALKGTHLWHKEKIVRTQSCYWSWFGSRILIECGISPPKQFRK